MLMLGNLVIKLQLQCHVSCVSMLTLRHHFSVSGCEVSVCILCLVDACVPCRRNTFWFRWRETIVCLFCCYAVVTKQVFVKYETSQNVPFVMSKSRTLGNIRKYKRVL